MEHKEIYKWFELYLPQFAKNVAEWFPNGKNSVRVRMRNGQDFIFTCNGTDDWSFETVVSFINNKMLKKGGSGVTC